MSKLKECNKDRDVKGGGRPKRGGSFHCFTSLSIGKVTWFASLRLQACDQHRQQQHGAQKKQRGRKKKGHSFSESSSVLVILLFDIFLVKFTALKHTKMKLILTN